MTPSVWRSVLLAFCALGATLQILLLCDVLGVGGAQPWFGVWGINFGTSGEPYQLSALAVDPNGPAYRAGVRQRDLIDVRPTNLVDRIAEFYQPLNGRPIAVSIRRGAQSMNLAVVPGPYLRGDTWLSVLSSLWILLFAALAVSASAALDHAEAVRMREESVALAKEVELMRVELATLRADPVG
jgi:hypothetical protein